MKTGRLLIAAALTALFAVIAGPAASSQAAPYPPVTCPQLAISTTTPFPGQEITVSGSGFDAGQNVTLVMRSGDVVLAHATADASGNFSSTVTIPEDATGNHVIAVQGDTSGCPVDPIQIRVQGHGIAGVSAGGGGGGLAFTGVDILAAVAIALALITAGVILAGSGRRHRRPGVHGTNH